MRHLFLILLLAGCEADHKKVETILKAEGCTDIEVGGWSMTGCGKDDNQSNEFTCTRNHVQVKGVVCSQFGLFAKGYTVRYF
jgi:hypothetical protein